MKPVRCACFSAFSSLLVLALTGCGTCIKVDPNGGALIQAGFASSIQQVTTTVKPGKNGAAPTIIIVQTGFDGTSVINNAAGAWVTGKTLSAGLKTVESNNHTTTAGKAIESKTTLGKLKLQNDATHQAAVDAAAAAEPLP